MKQIKIRPNTLINYAHAIKTIYDSLLVKKLKAEELVKICADKNVSRSIPFHLRKNGYISYDDGLATWVYTGEVNTRVIVEKILMSQRESNRKSQEKKRYRESQLSNLSGKKNAVDIDTIKFDEPQNKSTSVSSIEDSILIAECKRRGWKVFLPQFIQA